MKLYRVGINMSREQRNRCIAAGENTDQFVVADCIETVAKHHPLTTVIEDVGGDMRVRVHLDGVEL